MPPRQRRRVVRQSDCADYDRTAESSPFMGVTQEPRPYGKGVSDDVMVIFDDDQDEGFDLLAERPPHYGGD